MGFNPAHLTGKRARQWVKSLTWAKPVSPLDLPTEVRKRIRHPEYIRGFTRVRTPIGRYHWVVFIRDRIALIDHPFKAGDRFLTEEAGMEVCRCYKVCREWKYATHDQERFLALPESFYPLVSGRRRSVNSDVTTFTWNAATRLVNRRRKFTTYQTNPDGPEHPSPWIEPESPIKQLFVSRPLSGYKSTYARIAQRIAKTWRLLIQLETTVSVSVPANFHVAKTDETGSSNYGIGLVAVRCVWKDRRELPRIDVRLECHLPTWWSRCRTRPTVRSPDGAVYLLLSAGPSPRSGAPVKADAVNLEHIRVALQTSKMKLNRLRVVDTDSANDDRDVPGTTEIPIVSGIITPDPKEPSGWLFDPPVTNPYRPTKVCGDRGRTQPLRPPELLSPWDWASPIMFHEFLAEQNQTKTIT